MNEKRLQRFCKVFVENIYNVAPVKRVLERVKCCLRQKNFQKKSWQGPDLETVFLKSRTDESRVLY